MNVVTNQPQTEAVARLQGREPQVEPWTWRFNSRILGEYPSKDVDAVIEAI